MKDLRVGEEKFQILEHQKYRLDGKLPQLWSAFCLLVNSLLLPMANVNVIHLDIRSTATFTYNIMVCASNDVVELRLIDYDSLVFCDSTSGTKQEDAVYWRDLDDAVVTVKGISKKSAHRYLLWQVLWIVFRWHTPPSASAVLGSLAEKPTASNFLISLFKENYYMDFKKWLGTKTVESIKKTLETETITATSITDTLASLAGAFNGKSVRA
jgi:hypothetical protein